jgi:hypothetical protein
MSALCSTRATDCGPVRPRLMQLLHGRSIQKQLQAQYWGVIVDLVSAISCRTVGRLASIQKQHCSSHRTPSEVRAGGRCPFTT